MDKKLPKFIVFEGVDGVGKSSVIEKILDVYKGTNIKYFYDSFPGTIKGTLGEFVYRMHHNNISDSPHTSLIAPPAVQLLHVAAHVDKILNSIKPMLDMKDGHVILDRYWWSTYAYSRVHLPRSHVLELLRSELVFWKNLPKPIIFYITRKQSLKPDEVDTKLHADLNKYYQEIIRDQKKEGVKIYRISNDNHLEKTMAVIMKKLYA